MHSPTSIADRSEKPFLTIILASRLPDYRPGEFPAGSPSQR
jgi:hypothetical protein